MNSLDEMLKESASIDLGKLNVSKATSMFLRFNSREH